MITRDTTTETPDWIPQPGRHCGELCFDVACPVCGEFVNLKTPATIIRGCE